MQFFGFFSLPRLFPLVIISLDLINTYEHEESLKTGSCLRRQRFPAGKTCSSLEHTHAIRYANSTHHKRAHLKFAQTYRMNFQRCVTSLIKHVPSVTAPDVPSEWPKFPSLLNDRVKE